MVIINMDSVFKLTKKAMRNKTCHYILLIILQLNFVNLDLSAQKPPIDSSVYRNWPSVKSLVISNDGKYAKYTIENQPANNSTQIIQSTVRGWKKEFIGDYEVAFTENSKLAVFYKADSLLFITLSTKMLTLIADVKSYKISNANNENEQWLAYQCSKREDELIVKNLSSRNKKSFQRVKAYGFSEDGSVLLIQQSKNESSNEVVLQLVNLTNMEVTSIWEGENLRNIVFNKNRDQLAFISDNKNGKRMTSNIWLYNIRSREIAKLLNTDSSKIMAGYDIAFISRFSLDGLKIFFNIKKQAQTFFKRNEFDKVNVWSYKDVNLQLHQMLESTDRTYLCMLNVSNSNVVRLEQVGEQVYLAPQPLNDDILSVSMSGSSSGRNFMNQWLTSFSLISVNNGVRISIPEECKSVRGTLSPHNKFLVFYDPSQRGYKSYEVSTGIIRSITIGVIFKKYSEDYDRWVDLSNSAPASQIVGWLKDDKGVLIEDKFDLWKIDLTGKHLPICITKKIGREKKTRFRLMSERKIYGPDESIDLIAYNMLNKNNGFYEASLKNTGSLKELSMGPYAYYIPMGDYGTEYGIRPLKAKNSKSYILMRSTVEKSQNVYYTSNLQTFKGLSNIEPEKKYNWLKSELISWDNKDGSRSQGVLYKPENFDHRKRYPVILYIYEKLSDRLHVFQKPEPSDGRLNIAWYVSNGYLVLTPDIYYKKGEPGESALENVMSSINYISSLSFVNKEKIGIQGISMGGFETNYIITHTNIFAAACSASGSANLISQYGYIDSDGTVSHSAFETGQMRIGASLWENPDAYIRNSPIFQADSLRTPTLLFHTTFDGRIPFSQASEFFTALSHLGKKVWMLEYTDGNHGVWGQSAMDFDLRMQQFFNHYLKDTPAPVWMTRGVPYRYKQVQDGLELDHSGVQP